MKSQVIMKTKCRLNHIFLLAFILPVSLFAQNNPDKKHIINYGLGLGMFNPIGLNKNIDVPYAISQQAMVEVELRKGSKVNWQSGVFYQLNSLTAESWFNSINSQLVEAPDSVKYTNVKQHSIQIPLRVRKYTSKTNYGRFYELGVTAGYAISNKNVYKLNGELTTSNLKQANNFLYGVNIGIGKRINNRVTIVRFSYQLNPYFKNSNAMQLNPLIVSVNLLL